MYNVELDRLDESVGLGEVELEGKEILRLVRSYLVLDTLPKGDEFYHRCVSDLRGNIKGRIGDQVTGLKIPDEVEGEIYPRDFDYLYPVDIHKIMFSNIPDNAKSKINRPIDLDVSFSSVLMRQMIFNLLRQSDMDLVKPVLSQIIGHYVEGSKLNPRTEIIIGIINDYFHKSNFELKYRYALKVANHDGSGKSTVVDLMNCLDGYGMDYSRLHIILEAMRAGLNDDHFAFLSVFVIEFLVGIDAQIELISSRLKYGNLPDYIANLYLCDNDDEYMDKLAVELDIWKRLKQQRILISSKIKGKRRKSRKKSR